jgi:hypothetical protein
LLLGSPVARRTHPVPFTRDDDGEQRKIPVLEAAGSAIELAVDDVLADPGVRTRDLGGALNTDAFGNRVAQAVASEKVKASP